MTPLPKIEPEVLTEEELLEKLGKIRNKALQKLLYVYWKFGYAYFSAADVKKFIDKEIGLKDANSKRKYYKAFALLCFVSNRRKAAAVAAARRRKPE